MPVTLFNASDERNNTKRVFNRLRRQLAGLLDATAIEEIGSSAIPGALTKGDVDIVVLVRQDKFDGAQALLKQHYEVNEGMENIPLFASFKGVYDSIDFGIQLLTDDAEFGFIRFRDMLLADPELVRSYNDVKTKACQLDMNAYREHKHAFIEKTLTSIRSA